MPDFINEMPVNSIIDCIRYSNAVIIEPRSAGACSCEGQNKVTFSHNFLTSIKKMTPSRTHKNSVNFNLYTEIINMKIS